jgi:hypothetical protein
MVVSRICLFITAIALSAIFCFACSNSALNSTVPDSNQYISDEIPIFSVSDISSDRIPAGMWEMAFDSSSMDISISPSRLVTGHMNVKAYIPAPSVQVISYDPLTGIVEADITFQNPTSLNVFDFRMIVYSDDYGFRLRNPDDYTNLFDIPGGMTINPFRAFACGEWRRQFSAYTLKTARVQLYFPGGSSILNFAVDVSYPGNCLEPYSIQNWTCGTLQPETSSYCDASVVVYDWQYNVNSVQFWCPAISGQVLIPFSKVDSYTWAGLITNTAGAKEGYYTGVIIAGSSDSGSQMLYDLFQIQVLAYTPKVIQTLYTPNGAADVDVSGNYAYIAGEESGLIIADISNPMSPFITATFPFSLALFVDYDRGFAYLRDNNNRIRIISVNDPYNPGEVNSIITFGDEIRNFEASGNYLYIAGGVDGLVIYDIRDKRNPVFLTSLYLADFTWSVNLIPTHAFVGTENGFAIVDIRTPSAPSLVKNYVDNCRVNNCAVNGNTLYTAGHFDGLSIFDLTDFQNPVLKSRLGMSQVGSAYELYYRDNGVMIADTAGFSQVDVTLPENPVPKHRVYAGYSNGFAVTDYYVYLADTGSGLKIIQLNQP